MLVRTLKPKTAICFKIAALSRLAQHGCFSVISTCIVSGPIKIDREAGGEFFLNHQCKPKNSTFDPGPPGKAHSPFSFLFFLSALPLFLIHSSCPTTRPGTSPPCVAMQRTLVLRAKASNSSSSSILNDCLSSPERPVRMVLHVLHLIVNRLQHVLPICRNSVALCTTLLQDPKTLGALVNISTNRNVNQLARLR